MAENDNVPDYTAVQQDGQASSQETSKTVLWINKARRVLLVIGILYVGAVFLLCTPFVQRQALYLHNIKIPLFPNFDLPEKYGLAPNKTLNMRVPTIDGESLGAWFILSDHYYHKLSAPPTKESLLAKHIPVAIQNHPTVLFFHGNAATRAFHARVQHYTAFSSRLGANVLAIDYRGFADSTGTPSENGLFTDARAAWDWLARKGVDADNVLIVGHSLGTGVSAGLAKELARDGIACKGVVLLSPFSSIQDVLQTYHIFGLVPLMKPLAMIPWATDLLHWFLVHKFDTLKAVPNIDAPVLIAHAENDWDIPHTHSDVLFNAFLDGVLPELDLPANTIRVKPEEYHAMTSSIAKRQATREKLVTRTDMAGFGYTESFWDGTKERNVTLVKTLYGGHDYLGVQEGVQDAIGHMFGFF
ncbi:alpha/beta-hydrolase [Macrolepiota fuliginosa MF-IS2]|uniref:Alpha/beta-hydrolase n=1 Tax=Macrolepiota fuliginosa MF-IS2 TaxID=1400762 RepID=A0A9P5XS90_9AGAR|nr:alpha/beta-hydrolase [Macrolepiota fuliginosa MF-IS2]